ncbi:MAG: hypothetical protein LJE59_04275 [Chromatiaceae bacterium]|jgi:hypothetical protein|nr:hypothetical protein [Chromatiaceae bacterium]
MFMSGGIGAIGEAAMSASAGQDRSIASVNNANEIFYHLDGRHVFFDSGTGQLFFVDAPQGLIASTVQSAMAGMRATPVFEQLHLDIHRLFSAARCVALSTQQADAVLVALRLVGVRATVR